MKIRQYVTLAFAASLAVTSPLQAQDQANETVAGPTYPLEDTINEVYAYLERFETGQMPVSEKLRKEALAAKTRNDQLLYAERALLLLADHHAMTRNSLKDSWGVSARSDFWVERIGDNYLITSVRDSSPAHEAGLVAGSRVTAIGDTDINSAIAEFWQDLGIMKETDAERNAFAARVLTIGRRDRIRDISVQQGDGIVRRHKLQNLYMTDIPNKPLVEAVAEGKRVRVIMNDSLGNNDTIAAFDEVMASLDRETPVILDLRETASGGNTTVARAIMGWFVDKEMPYQVHSMPAEKRVYGVERKWRELVLPREGKFHTGPVEVQVSRWTGSMGEGIAIGMDALGHSVCGGKMAGLLGAVYTLDFEGTGLQFNLPYERLYAVDGTPREDFVAEPC